MGNHANPDANCFMKRVWHNRECTHIMFSSAMILFLVAMVGSFQGLSWVGEDQAFEWKGKMSQTAVDITAGVGAALGISSILKSALVDPETDFGYTKTKPLALWQFYSLVFLFMGISVLLTVFGTARLPSGDGWCILSGFIITIFGGIGTYAYTMAFRTLDEIEAINPSNPDRGTPNRQELTRYLKERLEHKGKCKHYALGGMNSTESEHEFGSNKSLSSAKKANQMENDINYLEKKYEAYRENTIKEIEGKTNNKERDSMDWYERKKCREDREYAVRNLQRAREAMDEYKEGFEDLRKIARKRFPQHYDDNGNLKTGSVEESVPSRSVPVGPITMTEEPSLGYSYSYEESLLHDETESHSDFSHVLTIGKCDSQYSQVRRRLQRRPITTLATELSDC